jgi:glycine/D-amino acid oxidase-like deaminating enzyme/nitrite reductase/ring-hydroxylating ferredoxin subunit
MAEGEIVSDGALKENQRADVCIVGAGIAGMTTAYLLAREGRSVIVLDDGAIGGGMTARTTAHLVNALDDRYYELERLHGEKGSRLAAESHSAAVDKIEAIVSEENIDCAFERVDGYLFVPPGESTDKLDDELAATHRAGISGVEKVQRAPIKDFDTGPALRFPNQAQFHPLRYLAGLAAAIRRDGGLIFTDTHATEIEGGGNTHVTAGNGFEVECDAVVVATNSPVNDRFVTHTKQAPYITYVIGARIPAGSVEKALLWDTPDPYHYIRTAGGTDGASEILIVGGEDHKTGQADDQDARFANLEAWTRERFPMIEGIEYRWSGQVMEPVDGLAFIGRNPLDDDNVFVATGDSGNGMTHGTIAGMLIIDLIQGRENEWADIYDPGRKTLRSIGEFAKENLNVAAQYTDLIRPGDVDSQDNIPAGEGAVIRDGLKKFAVYKDEAGKVHIRSAICVHLGCIVDWNNLEKTWDCPCHGSRFDKYGKVFQGPANRDLDPAE